MTLTRTTRRERHEESSVPVGRVDVGGHSIEVVESRTNQWLFDRGRRRFLRLPRGVGLDVSVLAMPWQSYAHVSLDGEGGGVVVTLADGGRVRFEASNR